MSRRLIPWQTSMRQTTISCMALVPTGVTKTTDVMEPCPKRKCPKRGIGTDPWPSPGLGPPRPLQEGRAGPGATTGGNARWPQARSGIEWSSRNWKKATVLRTRTICLGPLDATTLGAGCTDWKQQMERWGWQQFCRRGLSEGARRKSQRQPPGLGSEWKERFSSLGTLPR